MSNGDCISWECCPMDIMFTIFEQLSLTDINSCFQVNEAWRNVVTYYCSHYNLWEKLVKVTILESDNVKDHTYVGAGNQDMYMNSILWNDIHLATCKISYFHAAKAKEIHIDNDRLTVVRNGKVIIYNVSELTPLKIIKNNYEDCQYKGDVKITIVKESLTKYKLNIYSNCSCKNKRIFFNIPRPDLWIMNKRMCYFIDTNYTIWKYIYRDCDKHCHFITKYYGNRTSILQLFMDDHTLLLPLSTGKMYQYLEVDGLVHKNFFGLRSEFQLHYLDLHITIYNCPSPTQLPNTNNQLFLSNVSTAIRHGNMIIIGYNNGMLEVYKSRTYLKKLHQFHLGYNDTSMPIRRILVSEGNRTHTIFALVGQKIAKIHLTHEV